mmetsp:Transcript_79635/g.221587  ORF Transcript_79635/g.221587 Transcript_79635/m.221587 type:complete len:280 (+) Transcript_79635:1144-1983(+)
MSGAWGGAAPASAPSSSATHFEPPRLRRCTAAQDSGEGVMDDVAVFAAVMAAAAAAVPVLRCRCWARLLPSPMKCAAYVAGRSWGAQSPSAARKQSKNATEYGPDAKGETRPRSGLATSTSLASPRERPVCVRKSLAPPVSAALRGEAGVAFGSTEPRSELAVSASLASPTDRPLCVDKSLAILERTARRRLRLESLKASSGDDSASEAEERLSDSRCDMEPDEGDAATVGAAVDLKGVVPYSSESSAWTLGTPAVERTTVARNLDIMASRGTEIRSFA